jgi:coenzyme F420-reducing hydrogenase delta subunit
MRALAIIITLLMLGAAAYAAETITYTYDARGRLIRVAHSGTVNNNVATNYVYDDADNRTQKNTTGP